MTHKQLVEKARQWLISAKGCNPVFCEKGSINISEFPDAIGWKAHCSYVIECKNTLSDFKADFRKFFRNDENRGLGKFRYYLIPLDLIEIIKPLVNNGWGIVVVQDKDHIAYQYRLCNSKEFESNLLAEISYLRSRILEIQRFGI